MRVDREPCASIISDIYEQYGDLQTENEEIRCPSLYTI